MVCWLNVFMWIKWHCVHSHVSWNIMSSCFKIRFWLRMWVNALVLRKLQIHHLTSEQVMFFFTRVKDWVYTSDHFLVHLNCSSRFYSSHGLKPEELLSWNMGLQLCHSRMNHTERMELAERAFYRLHVILSLGFIFAHLHPHLASLKQKLFSLAINERHTDGLSMPD